MPPGAVPSVQLLSLKLASRQVTVTLAVVRSLMPALVAALTTVCLAAGTPCEAMLALALTDMLRAASRVALVSAS